ncbi:olfactory receptor 52D1-like [Lepisosteus oculatus]|uniref:olfactory receptor 52D1-like n=1 Tax=Lepisosteus oculatus TaxID=7918 RepID=UPI0037186F6B
MAENVDWMDYRCKAMLLWRNLFRGHLSSVLLVQISAKTFPGHFRDQICQFASSLTGTEQTYIRSCSSPATCTLADCLEQVLSVTQFILAERGKMTSPPNVTVLLLTGYEEMGSMKYFYFVFIFVAFLRILRACLKASKEARGKALTTCLPHIITFLTFCINVLFEVISRRLDNSSVPLAVRTFLSLQLFIVPPLLNPLVYGLRLQEMRSTVEKVFLRHKSAVQHNL